MAVHAPLTVTCQTKYSHSWALTPAACTQAWGPAPAASPPESCPCSQPPGVLPPQPAPGVLPTLGTQPAFCSASLSVRALSAGRPAPLPCGRPFRVGAPFLCGDPLPCGRPGQAAGKRPTRGRPCRSRLRFPPSCLQTGNRRPHTCLLRGRRPHRPKGRNSSRSWKSWLGDLNSPGQTQPGAGTTSESADQRPARGHRRSFPPLLPRLDRPIFHGCFLSVRSHRN